MKKLLPFLVQPTLMFLATSVAYGQALNVPAPVNVPAVSLGSVISAVVGVLLLFAAILAFLYLMLGGIQWITSGGDKAGVEAARNKITNAIVGLIIVAAAWAVMLLLGQFTGVDILKEGGLKIPTIGNPTEGI